MSDPLWSCEDCENAVESPVPVSRCLDCGGNMVPRAREQPAERPDRPDDVAEYVLDGIDRQGADDLRAIAHYALALAEWYDRDLEADEIEVDDGEEIVDVEKDSGSSGTIVTKKVPCGKDCSGCPHGPYRYRNYRDGDTVRTEYLGKAD